MFRLIAGGAVFVLVLSVQVCIGQLGQKGQQARPEPITNESVASFAGENLDDGSAVLIGRQKVFWFENDVLRIARRESLQGTTLARRYPPIDIRPAMVEPLPPMKPVLWPGDAAMTVPITAVELMAHYEVNEFLADERLRPPKSLYLKGVVIRINAGGPEGNFIALRTDDLVADIRCYFTERQAQRFRLVAKGDLATIRGSCAGRPLQDVILYDCKLVTSVRPKTPFAPWEWPFDTSRRIRMRKGFEFLHWPAGTQRYEVSRNGNVIHNSSGHIVRTGADELLTKDPNYWRSVRSQSPAWVRHRPN